MTVFGLILIGFLLVFLEFYLPGAILGIAGGVFILIGFFLFVLKGHSAFEIILLLLSIVVGLAFLIKFAIWKIKNTKPSKSIYSDASQEGNVATSFDHTLIGKEAVVLTDLKPGGFILVEGSQQPAISVEGYLSKGTKVKIIDGSESNLIVRKE